MALYPMKTLQNAMTAFVLLIVALAGAEFWLRGNTPPAMQRVTGRVIDADQPLLVASSVCHHTLQPGLTIQHQISPRGKSQLFRVNSLGFRGEEPIANDSGETFRILILGDDCICGTAVKEEETVSARLHEFLKSQTQVKLEILNCGVPGYCPLLSWLQFDHDLAKLKPDLVILHVDMSDVSDDACYRSLLLTKDNQTVCEHATLRLLPKPEHAISRFIKQSATASWLFAKARTQAPEILTTTPVAANAGLFEWTSDNPADLRLQVRHALEPIVRLKESVESAGGRLLVTTAPVLWQIVSADAAPRLSQSCGIHGATPYRSRFPFEVLQAFCSHSQVRFCDTSSAFESGEKKEKLFSTDSPVLSRIGMALYAREIARYLITNPPSDW